MSKKRIAMNKVKDILRMILVEDKSMRSIASLTGIPYSTISDNVSLVKQKGLDWSQIEYMSEEALECVLSDNDNQRPLPRWEEVEKELKRKGVTLQLLWQEHHESTKFTGYKYSRFCQLYEAWCKKNDVYTPMPHKAGEELFVDYSGQKISYTCLETGNRIETEVFVAVLGASGRIYSEPSKSQQIPDWIESNINAFEYNQGVTELLIPDNLKSAVTTPDRYEASINKTFEEFGRHYGTYILPARVRKPKDKSKVEEAVQCVQREIIAPLRNKDFLGKNALDVAFRERLDKLNNRPFKKLSGSRESRYEEIDKPVLNPLPATRYCLRDWFTKLPVGQNHLVLIDIHSYSVPYQYTRSKVDAVADTKMVELFHKGQVIARHVRSYDVGGQTILREHMPPKYQHYFDSLDKDKLLVKAREIGSNFFTWVELILALGGRPPRTLCRTVQGAFGLVKEFGKDRMEVICGRAVICNIHSYKELRTMLVNGADYLPLPEAGDIESHLPQDHENVRGAEFYS